MTFLTGLLPGVRELRAPFTAGILWVLALYLFAPASFTEIATTPPISQAFAWLASQGSVGLVVLGGLSFLVGSVMHSPVSALTAFAGRRLLRFGQWFASRALRITEDSRGRSRRLYWPYRLANSLALRNWPMDRASWSLLVDLIMVRLARVGVPGSASIMLPLEGFTRNIQYSSPQLATTAESQYQEYDRIRSELDFRISIAPPLALLSFLIPTSSRWAVASLGILLAVILWVQAVGRSRAAGNLLANCAYLELVKLPALESVAAFVEQSDAKPDTTGGWVAVLIMALNQMGLVDEEEELLEEASTFDQKRDQDDVIAGLPVDSEQRTRLAQKATAYQIQSLADPGLGSMPIQANDSGHES